MPSTTIKLPYHLDYLAKQLDRQASALNFMAYSILRQDHREIDSVDRGNVEILRLVIDRLEQMATDTRELLKEEGYDLEEEGNNEEEEGDES